MLKEWEEDGKKLNEKQDPRLSLKEPLGVPLPVCPTEHLHRVVPDKSFVAHSAAAPMVVCYALRPAARGGAVGSEDEPTGQQDEERLYAIKGSDDLRQDALILQMFSLMEK